MNIIQSQNTAQTSSKTFTKTEQRIASIIIYSDKPYESKLNITPVTKHHDMDYHCDDWEQHWYKHGVNFQNVLQDETTQVYYCWKQREQGLETWWVVLEVVTAQITEVVSWSSYAKPSHTHNSIG